MNITTILLEQTKIFHKTFNMYYVNTRDNRRPSYLYCVNIQKYNVEHRKVYHLNITCI